MTRQKTGGNLLRPENGEQAHRVTYAELFFDLIFVFAVTQLSHGFLAHMDLTGLWHTAMMTVLIWWVWIYTAWCTNWINPQRWQVAGLLIVLMLLGLVMSTSLPEAFGETGLAFALAMVAFQLIRTVFVAIVMRKSWPENSRNFVRIAVWLAFSGAVWITGGALPEELRPAVWLGALVLDVVGPRVRFWVPGLGATDLKVWQVKGQHIAERVGLFIIIALGESIIITGSTLGGQGLDGLRINAFLAAFASTVLMWVLFFRRSEQTGSEFISKAHTTGLIAQVSYTYIPVLLVIGIVFTAVADELVIAHPVSSHGEGNDPLAVWLICGSTAFYLLGNLLFKRSVGGPWFVPQIAGILLLAALGFLQLPLSLLVYSWITNGVLLLVCAADEVVQRNQRA